MTGQPTKTRWSSSSACSGRPCRDPAASAGPPLLSGWYYAPGEWPTTDGYAPFGVVWVEFMGLQALHARRTLEVADGYTVAQAKDGRRARRELQSAAYPAEVC
jgi:hypothetical protein